MTERSEISGKIVATADSKERVAFDLMMMIKGYEGSQTNDREYFLRLYEQCRSVVTGESATTVLGRR